MNRILFEPGEIIDGVVTFGGERAEHVLSILHGEVGQVLKTGEIGGLIGNGVITAINGGEVTVETNHDHESAKPWIDLILAPPRPRVMKRLLPQLATLGVGEIVLVGAKKTEKDFWGATLLKPANYRPLLIDGLMQAGTSILPNLRMEKSLNRYLKGGLTEFAGHRRLIAHPYDVGAGAGEAAGDSRVRRPVVAIGPEGGWTDDEVAAFERLGFGRYSLGSRILRTDTACVALLAQLMKEYGE